VVHGFTVGFPGTGTSDENLYHSTNWPPGWPPIHPTTFENKRERHLRERESDSTIAHKRESVSGSSKCPLTKWT